MPPAKRDERFLQSKTKTSSRGFFPKSPLCFRDDVHANNPIREAVPISSLTFDQTPNEESFGANEKAPEIQPQIMGVFMLHTRSILVKMLTSSALLIVFLIGIGFIGLHALVQVADKYEHIARVNLPNSHILSQMSNQTLEISRSYLRIALPGTPQAEIHKRKESIRTSIEAYEAYDTRYRAITFVAGEQELYDDLRRQWEEYLKAVHNALALLQQPHSREKFQKEVETTLSKLRADHGEAMTRIIDFQLKESDHWVQLANTTAAQYRKWMVLLVLIGALGAMILSFVSARSLAHSLRSISKQIDEAGTQVRAASEQMASASQQLSSGATQAASALEETVASVEELSSMVQLNASNAREASTLSEQSRQSADEGEKEIAKLNSAIHEIAQSSKKIEEIINVIDDIAFQTNLLALNAAVEAARAGEQGKGFAVVAEAVRTLAQRSASAAKDITSLIKESVVRIERGERMADESGNVLKKIVISVSKVASLNNEIATASEEQAHGLSQISKAMNELDQATQRNATSAEETAASSEEMSGQASSMEILVGQLNAVIEGQGKRKNDSGKVSEESPSARHEHWEGKNLAKVTPLRRRTGKNSEHVIPLASEELRQRKVGNIDEF
jgi:methyl-accepting chemotaxis protein